MLDYKILNNVNSVSDFQRAEEEFQMKKKLAQAELKKAGQIDVDKLGEQAFMKAAMGAELSPEERAAAEFLDAKSGGISINPATGEVYQKPRISDKIGLGGLAQNRQPPAASAPSYGGNATLLPAFDGMPSGLELPAPSGIGRMTPKGKQSFIDENIKADRKRIDDAIAAANSAGSAKASAQRMSNLQSDLGYTGFGAAPINLADKALTGLGLGEYIKGSPSSREAFQAESVNSWVKTVEPLKGSLTEREGARFDAAIPSLSMTPEGIKMMNELSIALSKRANEKSQFYQNYYNQVGTLAGADAEWQAYADASPVIPESFGKPTGAKSVIDLNAVVNKLRANGVSEDRIQAYIKSQGR